MKELERLRLIHEIDQNEAEIEKRMSSRWYVWRELLRPYEWLIYLIEAILLLVWWAQ